MIDLDLTIDLDDPPPERPRPALPVGRWLTALAGLVSLLATLSLSAAGAPDWPLRPDLIRADFAAGFALNDGVVYAVQTTGDQPRMAAYRLSDGRRLWSGRAPFRINPDSLLPAGPLLLLLSSQPAGRTVALDRRTGEVRWQARGQVISVAPSGAVAVIGHNLTVPVDSTPRSLAGIDTVDGRQRWVRTVATFGEVQTMPDGSVTVRSSERVVTYDPLTGADTHTPDLPAQSPVADVDGVRIVETPDGLVAEAPGWRTPLPTGIGGLRTARVIPGPGPEDSRFVVWTAPRLVGVDRCGRWVCVGLTTQTVALDAATGRIVWQSRHGGITGTGVPGRLLASNEAQLVAMPGAADFALLDELTGTVVRGLAGWTVAGWSPRWLALTRPADRGVEVAALDIATGALIRLGATGAGTAGCRADGWRIACPDGDRGLRVWRYRPF